MKYINIHYENSECHKATLSASDSPQQLINKRHYTVMAIEYHRQAGNPGQVKFFEADLALIDQLLGKLKSTQNRGYTPLEALKILRDAFIHNPDNPKGNVHKNKVITTCPDVQEALNIARQTQWDAEKQEALETDRLNAAAPVMLAALKKANQNITQLCQLVCVTSGYPKKARAEDFAEEVREAIALVEGES